MATGCCDPGRLFKWLMRRFGADEPWLPMPYEASMRLHASPEAPRPLVYELGNEGGDLVGFSHTAPCGGRPRFPAAQRRKQGFRAYVDIDWRR